jgi:hypothetical protein
VKPVGGGKREEGGGRREGGGGGPAAYLEGGRWRLAAPRRDGGWSTGSWARWRLAAPGRGGSVGRLGKGPLRPTNV